MSQNLFVSSLAYQTTDDGLRAAFEAVGEVASARVITDRETGRSRGFGFVEFANEADNDAAIKQLDGTDLDGRTIKVAIAQPKPDRPRREFNGGFNGGRDNRRRSF